MARDENMSNKFSYVEWIQDHRITIYCNDKDKSKKIKILKGKRKFFSFKYWIINYRDEYELAKILASLRNENFFFGFDEHGWSPSGIFQYLREKGMLTGKFIEIFWRGKDKIGTREV